MFIVYKCYQDTEVWLILIRLYYRGLMVIEHGLEFKKYYINAGLRLDIDPPILSGYA